jgi:hypothetical protein
MPSKPWPAEKSGEGTMHWLNAGPDFLTGIQSQRYLPQIDNLEAMFHTFLKVPGQNLGKKYATVGMRGKQKVQEINRLMVKRAVFKKFVTFVSNHVGRLKASFVATAKKLQPSTTAPQWIGRHITNGATPKSITDLTGLENIQHPSVTFGSRSPGVTKFQGVVQKAVATRKAKVAARLRLVLAGYAKDNSERRPIRRHAKEAHA